MKKLFATIFMVAAFSFASVNANAQGYLEGNFGLSKYTQAIDDVDFDNTVTNFSIGYNLAISSNLYFGGTLGYSNIKNDDNDDLNFNVYTITPKLTYEYKLSNMFSWTPNVYFTFGYGSDEINVAGYKFGDVTYTNMRIGVNPLSFDIHLLPVLSINITALNPYYNILSTSVDTKIGSRELKYDNTFVYLGGTIGVKFSL